MIVIRTPQVATTSAAALWPISLIHHRRSSRSSATPTITITAAPARMPQGAVLLRKMSLTKNELLAVTSATRTPAKMPRPPSRGDRGGMHVAAADRGIQLKLVAREPGTPGRRVAHDRCRQHHEQVHDHGRTTGPGSSAQAPHGGTLRSPGGTGELRKWGGFNCRGTVFRKMKLLRRRAQGRQCVVPDRAVLQWTLVKILMPTATCLRVTRPSAGGKTTDGRAERTPR